MKILLIISNNIFCRNYLNNHVLDDLNKYSDLKILGNKNINSDKHSYFHFTCSEDRLNALLHWLIASIKLFSNTNVTKSFRMRVRRTFYPEIIGKLTFRKILKYIKKLLILLFFKSVTKFDFISNFFIIFFKKLIKINKSFKTIIENEKPDLVLIPTNGFFSFELDIEYTLHRLGKKYISLIDNWDNLSSKTMLIYKANHYGVWGEQNRIIAEEVQNINRSMSTSIGTPRYEVYKNKKIKKIFDFKYILFVGSSNTFNEFGILEILNNIIDKHMFDIKVVYRPHPWRTNINFPSLANLNNIVLDPQMKKQYENKNNSNIFQPELDYYNDILHNCEFVIGSLTSMLIEALIKKKNYIVLVHPEKGFKYSPAEWLKGYTTFEKLEKLKNLIFLDDLKNLETSLINLLNNKIKYENDEFLSYFITFDNESYSKKLIRLISDFNKRDK